MTMSGAIRVRLDSTPVEWSPLRALLAEHDKRMVLKDGIATFEAMDEVPDQGSELPEPTRQVASGPIVAQVYDGLTCNSADLNAAADKPNVLRITIGRQIVVQTVTPSDIKDGLHHLHRRGRVKPVAKRISRYACKHSRAAKQAAIRTSKHTSFVRKLVRYMST